MAQSFYDGGTSILLSKRLSGSASITPLPGQLHSHCRRTQATLILVKGMSWAGGVSGSGGQGLGKEREGVNPSGTSSFFILLISSHGLFPLLAEVQEDP